MKLVKVAMAIGFLILICGSAHADCTTRTINPAMAERDMQGLTPDSISALLGCQPIETPQALGMPQTLTWGLSDGALWKQIVVPFNYAGATKAKYQEIPIRGGSDNNAVSISTAVGLGLMLAASSSSRTVGSTNSVCTTATINRGAPQKIRPHMTPGAVSGVLGCSPTKLPPPSTFPLGVWVWEVPRVGLQPIELVTVGFDEAGSTLAAYGLLPSDMSPTGNGALRVEPSVPAYGNWVPGTAPPSHVLPFNTLH